MVSSLSIDQKKGYLAMTIQGTYDYWEFIEYPLQIRKACDDHKCDKVLLDVTPVTAPEISMIELFFIGEQIAKVFANRLMLALIWKKRESLSDFLADVATNRSARLKVFDDSKMAEYWLTQKY